MFTLLRELAAMPLKLLVTLLAILPVANNANILRWICIITNKPEDILIYLNRLSAELGPEKYHDSYLENMELYNDHRFAFALGLSYLERVQFEKLQELIQTVDSKFPENTNLNFLKLMLAFKANNDPLVMELSNKIIQSRDSSTEASELAYSCMCWGHIEREEFDRAKPLVEKILEIKESRVARVAAGVLAFKENNIKLSEKHFAVAANVDNRFPIEPLMAVAGYVCGDMKSAAEYVAKAIKSGIRLPENDRILTNIMESEEYKEIRNG